LTQSLDSQAFEALTKQWKTADDRIKRSERVQLVLNTPAVKELRDAGYHLVQALEASDKKTELEELNRAIRHATRASYDAVESEALFFLEQIKKFQADYRLIEINIDGLDYPAIRSRARNALNLTLLANRDKESRDQHYTALYGLCDGLSQDFDRLEDAREELNKKRRALHWKIGAGTATLIIAAIGAACALHARFSPCEPQSLTIGNCSPGALSGSTSR
jgi:hypothetical protein